LELIPVGVLVLAIGDTNKPIKTQNDCQDIFDTLESPDLLRVLIALYLNINGI
jgi:hypothetical protein